MPATPGRWPTPGCFDDVRVLEVGTEQGDFCGLLLAGEGAEVVKIEPPEGSPSRQIGPFYQDVPDPNRSLFFWTYNRGKRGVTLDLEQPGGREAYLELVRTADVMVDAGGLGVMDGLGIGYEQVRAIAPEIVYCSITPFGLTGPWRDFKASDLVHQALGGSAYCIGYNPTGPGKWDTPPFMPQAWHTYGIVGQHAALAIATALLYRQMSGQGQFIDVSIHDACAQNTEGTVPRYIYYKSNQERRLPSQVRCADGAYLNLSIARTVNFPRLVELLSASELSDDLEDPKYADAVYRARPEVAAHISELIRRWAASRLAMEAFTGLQSCRVICGLVRPPEELISDPHCIEREDFVEIEHPELGRSFVYPRGPRRQTETPWRWGPRAPLLGEHTIEVLSSLGLRA